MLVNEPSIVIDRHTLDLANYLFLDESGKYQDQDFICLCGYLSSGEKWDLFIAKWKTMTEKLGLPAVHMKTLRRDCADRGLNPELVLQDFIDIIRETILVGFAVGLDAQYYRGMPPAARAGMGDPAVACLQRMLRLVRNKFREVGYRDRISITLDDDETYATKCYTIVSRLRRANPELKYLIGATSFGDDTFILPLQAADILANLTGQWFRDRMTGKATADDMPPLLKRLQASPENGFGLEYRSELWDGSELRKHLHNFVRWNESQRSPTQK